MKKIATYEEILSRLFNPELLAEMAKSAAVRFPDLSTVSSNLKKTEEEADNEDIKKLGVEMLCLALLNRPEGVYHFANAMMNALFEDDVQRDYQVLYYLKHLFQKIGDIV